MYRRVSLLALTSLATLPVVAQITNPPTEKFTVDLGFRDWGPAAVSGNTVVAGNRTDRGGLFAVDTATGKRKWSYIPNFPSGTASVSTAPAISDNIVITPFSMAHPGAVVAVSLATGKELWRGPDPEVHAAVGVDGELAYFLSKTGTFHALEIATGRERWKATFATNLTPCASRPVIGNGAVYFTAIAPATPGDAAKPAGYYLFALDARTGQERWRYRPQAPYMHNGVCLSQPLLAGDTIYATGDSRLYAIQAQTGRDRWPSVEVRRFHDGRERAVAISPLIDAGPLVIGMTPVTLTAFHKDSGRTAWELTGKYREVSPSLATSGNILYFQGSPDIKPAPSYSGTLHALDLNTRSILWSFSHPNPRSPNWSFGDVVPVSGGLWVDTYQALLKLQ